MRVGVNGLFLDDPHTGTGVYTRQVLARLASSGSGLRYTIFGHPEHESAIRQIAAPAVFVPLSGPLRRVSSNVEKVVWEQAALPLAAARCGVDLLYSPYFSLPLRTGGRTAVTVHDVIPLLLPEYAPSPRLRAYFRLVAAAARRASAIVTDSRCSAGDIARVLDVPRERIHVIYLGVDDSFNPRVPAERVHALRARLGLPERFMLYMGGSDPRKNVPLLFEALREVAHRGRVVMPLVVVAGRSDRALRPEWAAVEPRAAAARIGVASGVIFLDAIDDADKPALLSAATAFLYPSRYEGFGLPPLEAMASGTPVICSNAASLPEVTGEAALSLHPDDVGGWADAIERVDGDDGLRRDLAQHGLDRAAQFTWERTVAELTQLLGRLLSA